MIRDTFLDECAAPPALVINCYVSPDDATRPSPEQWRWSSYRYYALGEDGAVKIEG
jgi:hypothetical protein